jgi:hypothetical protein
MKNIKSLQEFLFESKSSAKKRFLDRELISEEIFNTFLEIDTTPTKKFIEKMCEFFVAGSTQEDIIQTFQKATQSKIKFDISLIKSLSELQGILSREGLSANRNKLQLSANEKGAEITYEDDRFLVLYITTEQASKKYGKGTKWCISAERDNMWRDYKVGGSVFYFIFDYKTKLKSLSKIAVEVLNHDSIYSYFKIWNTTDNKSGKIVDIDYIYSELGIPESTFSKHKEIVEFKETYGIQGDYTINEDGSIDVDGNVILTSKKINKLSMKYGKVSGDFDCSGVGLTTLECAPHTVRRFNCAYNELENLKFAPSLVGENFICMGNNLTSLEGAPKRVRYFSCSSNKLTNLEFAPETITEDFNCHYNKLETLKYFPKYVGGEISLSNNNLSDLDCGLSLINGDFYCNKNNLTTLENMPEKINGNFVCAEQKNGIGFTQEEVIQHSEVTGTIYV